MDLALHTKDTREVFGHGPVDAQREHTSKMVFDVLKSVGGTSLDIAGGAIDTFTFLSRKALANILKIGKTILTGHW